MTSTQLQEILARYPPDIEVKILQPPYILNIKDVKEYINLSNDNLEIVLEGDSKV